jgi:hypothetical protein
VSGPYSVNRKSTSVSILPRSRFGLVSGNTSPTRQRGRTAARPCIGLFAKSLASTPSPPHVEQRKGGEIDVCQRPSSLTLRACVGQYWPEALARTNRRKTPHWFICKSLASTPSPPHVEQRKGGKSTSVSVLPRSRFGLVWGNTSPTRQRGRTAARPCIGLFAKVPHQRPLHRTWSSAKGGNRRLSASFLAHASGLCEGILARSVSASGLWY